MDKNIRAKLFMMFIITTIFSVILSFLFILGLENIHTQQTTTNFIEILFLLVTLIITLNLKR